MVVATFIEKQQPAHVYTALDAHQSATRLNSPHLSTESIAFPSRETREQRCSESRRSNDRLSASKKGIVRDTGNREQVRRPMTIDLLFPLIATNPIAADHGYHLYAGLSRLLPVLHEHNGIGVHPIRGTQIGNRLLRLDEKSALVLRVPDSRIGEFLPLAGKQLRIGSQHVRVGVPRVYPLTPAPALRSRLVTIKNGTDPEPFLKELRRKLDAFGVAADAQPTLGKRRTICIKEKEVVGYEVILEALSAEESLAIQENRTQGSPEMGWSRRHMGCAMFVPITAQEGR
jgi:CRISPR-associated protein Cas6